jgi:superfamily I DNA and RNA helicase
MFVGQVKPLEGIEKCLLGNSSGRCVFVIHGLAGSGKTQLALKFVDLHKSRCVRFKAALM